MSTLAFIVPAFEAATTVASVVRAIIDGAPSGHAQPLCIVVDDGSQDETSVVAAKAGATVIRHAENRGKGAALRTGFVRAVELGAQMAIAVDADGQHIGKDAWRVALCDAPADALVLGVRDLVQAGAPRLNQVSNRISTFFLSRFGRRAFVDTQCGLRRYPLERVQKATLESNGYAYESELLLTAALEKWPIVEIPVDVYYPPENERATHFHNVKDPARIVGAVLSTLTRKR